MMCENLLPEGLEEKALSGANLSFYDEVLFLYGGQLKGTVEHFYSSK